MQTEVERKTSKTLFAYNLLVIVPRCDKGKKRLDIKELKRMKNNAVSPSQTNTILFLKIMSFQSFIVDDLVDVPCVVQGTDSIAKIKTSLAKMRSFSIYVK